MSVEVRKNSVWFSTFHNAMPWVIRTPFGRPVVPDVSSGLYADGHSEDLRMARTEWSVPLVLDRAATALGY